MNLLKRLRPVLAILGLLALSAVCAMAQAEINPDHFDYDPQAPAIHKAPAQNASSAAVINGSQPVPKMHAQGHGSVAAAKSHAHQGSAAETEGVSSHQALNPATAEKRHKKLISEARHHGMP